MLKEDIDFMRPKAEELIQMVIDKIVFGPEVTTEQVMAIWTIIGEKANIMKQG
jgi:hypothetical protein